VSADLDDEQELTPGEELQDLLETLVEAFDVEGEVLVEEGEDTLHGRVEGEELGRMIGHHGQTIEAIQHLAQRIALRGGSGPRIVVDVGGYRAEREDTLRSMADRAADDALREDRAVSLEPMAAAERRFVHEYLRERGDVETHSEGEEPRRCLVVAPIA
jgi:spoIIIJ-associated protein